MSLWIYCSHPGILSSSSELIRYDQRDKANILTVLLIFHTSSAEHVSSLDKWFVQCVALTLYAHLCFQVSIDRYISTPRLAYVQNVKLNIALIAKKHTNGLAQYFHGRHAIPPQG